MELRTFHRASRRVVEDRPGAVAGDDLEAVCIFPQLPRRRSRSIVGHVTGGYRETEKQTEMPTSCCSRPGFRFAPSRQESTAFA
jgi:hypothetical protein